MIEERYKSLDVSIDNISPHFNEVYLEFYGINHLRPSYTAWIFFLNKLPKKVTPKSKGFAGTFAIFAHSECWGDVGHCHGDDGLRRFDTRPSHPMTRAFKRVPITHAFKKYLDSGRTSLDICIYAYSRMDWPNQGDSSLLCCKGLQLVTL